jgi:hypothetical protein
VATADSSTSSATNVLIGVLSDQQTALDSFASVHPAGIAASVAHLSLDDVGDSAILLRAFDLVAIDDFATDAFTAAQRTALADYAQNGGSLLLGAGASWRKSLAGVSSTILPMQPTGTTTLDSVAALGGLSGVEVATGSMAAGSHAWLSEGATPLLADKVVGSGMVTIATFDWNRDPIASWTGANTLLRQVLVRTVVNSVSTLGMGFGKAGFGGSTGSITERSNAVAQALGSLPSLDLPSLLVIGLLVLAYVLFVGPINYFALRAFHHRALAWVTVPLIAVVASAGAFGAGLFTKGRSVQTNQVSVIHLQPGWDRAYEESYTGVIAPTRGDYQVTVAGGRAMVGPLFSNNGGPPGLTPDLIRVGVDGNTVMLPGMTAFVLRGFATEGVIDAPHLVATAKLVNGKLTGTIRNDSTVAFTDAVVLAGNGYKLIPALAPGASANFEVVPTLTNPAAGPPAFATIYTNYFNGPPPNQPTDAERIGLEKTAILSMIAQNGFNGYSSSIAPMVVGWSNQSFEQVGVAGSQVRPTTETAVVLSLPVDSIGAGAVPAGVVGSKFTDMEGDSQPGPPSGFATQNGTVTYEFTPSIATGMHLTKAAIDTTSQLQYGGPPGSGQSLQVEAWDWSRSAWVPVSYSVAGTTALPDGVVDPASSEVRIRMTAGGSTVFLGPISLTGTVT